VRKNVFIQLTELFLANTNKNEFSKTLFELLSRSERIMLAKRVAIIGMLLYKCSIREISHTLKVSTATIWKIEKALQDGKLNHIKDIFKRKEYHASFLGILETIFTVGMTTNPNKRAKQKMYRAIEAFRAGWKF